MPTLELENAPDHARAIALWLTAYEGISRPPWLLRLGLWLYDRLAGRGSIGAFRWYGRKDLLARSPCLRPEGLQGAFLFFDGQMDECGLGECVVQQAQAAEVAVHVGRSVECVGIDGWIEGWGERHRYDRVINAADPRAVHLLETSGLLATVQLDQVRGSHILLDQAADGGFFLQVPGERRIFFVLPYQGQTLIGTTEVRQSLDEPILCSDAEVDYLLKAYNANFTEARARADVAGTFAGLRPLIRTAADPRKATREYLIERRNRLITVYGGKWTTARALSRSVANAVLRA